MRMVPLTASGSVCKVPSSSAYSFKVFLAKASNLRPASVINTPFLSRMHSLVLRSSSSLFKVLLKVDGLTWHSEAVLVRFEVSHSLKNVAASFRSSTLFSLSIKFRFEKINCDICNTKQIIFHFLKNLLLCFHLFVRNKFFRVNIYRFCNVSELF